MTLKYSLICSFVLLPLCLSHTLHFGRTCPKVQPYPNLDLDKILGNWYVVYQFDTSNTCIQWNFTKSTINPDKLVITEKSQQYLLDFVNVDHITTISATLDILNPEVPSNLIVHWPTSLTGSASFIIFDTDHTNYLTVFQCNRAGGVHRRDVTLLSRKPFIKTEIVERTRRLLDSMNVHAGALEKIEHKGCKAKGYHHWHFDGKFFGLGGESANEQLREAPQGAGVQDYDISEIELIGDGVSAMEETFRGSLKEKEKTPRL